ncbi:hypothetical protein CBY_3528 [Clostridium butyricum 5521]|uniref:Uncharacterized protein n=1 Tax=Clostridium butyricum E4 str. BoNT E BL5262 TaxID=632245 RepID=C4IDF9_CLOBU|nr:hypothetical protein CBY_3528 [Clostridium butyricum 5521]EEP55423.1 hypothetical protein CLP_3389 [Clostridium butyricum E4 str. BoNT E BL5262]EMU53447.1 hypothetical protein CBDKU1_23960 [Clostridium butyricum DKU-01]
MINFIEDLYKVYTMFRNMISTLENIYIIYILIIFLTCGIF